MKSPVGAKEQGDVADLACDPAAARPRELSRGVSVVHCDGPFVDAREDSMATRTVEPVRSEIRSLEPYVPGKPVEELERELHIQGAIKLASNENPLGPSPLAIEAIQKAAASLNRYPDGSSHYLRQAIARFWSVPFEQTAVGSGSNDLIDILCRIHLGAGDEAVMSHPA